MADETLAGLDEGALRKLVSGPIISAMRTDKPGRRGRVCPGYRSADKRR